MKPLPLYPCLAAALTLFSGCSRETTPPFTFQTAPLNRGELVQRVSASGSLSAVVRVDVGSQVSGKISALNADFNSPVKKGDLVAEIDPSLYSAIVLQAEGELASARATATLKKQNLERKQILFPKQAATQLDLEQAVAELAQAEATVTIGEAALQRSIAAARERGAIVIVVAHRPALIEIADQVIRLDSRAGALVGKGTVSAVETIRSAGW